MPMHLDNSMPGRVDLESEGNGTTIAHDKRVNRNSEAANRINQVETYPMRALRQLGRRSVWGAAGLGAMVFLAAACTTTPGPAPIPSATGSSPSNVVLDGRHEMPAVSTAATGAGVITILMDKSVSGSVTTSGVAGTAAHIHMGAAGLNGPVIVTLTKSAENVWVVPAGVRLTDVQYEAFKRGELYVNVHSAANPNGEIRGQLAQ